MIGHCKLCFDTMENDELATIHFKIFHRVLSFDVITIDELIQD